MEAKVIEQRVKNAGLEVVRIEHPSGAICIATLQGGHVLSYENSRGEQLLFLSSAATLAPGKAIRGGVPVIFPQFGPGKLPQHGFARTGMWTLQQPPTKAATGDCVVAVLALCDTEATRAVWPFAFELRLNIAVGPERLSLELEVTAPPQQQQQLQFTAALHTYLRIPDVRAPDTAVLPATQGQVLKGLRYTTQEPPHNDGTLHTETRNEIAVHAFTDRAYFGAPDALTVRCGGAGSTPISVVKGGGFRDTVVWNPWDERGAKLADLGQPLEWTQFLCIEAAAIEPVTLAPGTVWRGSQIISKIPLARL